MQKHIVPQIKKQVRQGEQTPEPDSSRKYQLRLIKTPNTVTNKRHIITRLLRFFPDLKWETAEGIVEKTLEEDMGAYSTIPDTVKGIVSVLWYGVVQRMGYMDDKARAGLCNELPSVKNT